MTDEANPLEGKVAVVTGAGRGLGRSIALALSNAGAAVVAAGRTERDLESFALEAQAAGATAVPVRCDVTVEADVAHLVARSVAELGHIDILVNNSGIIHVSPLLEQETEQWDRVMDTNIRGVYLMTRAAGRHLVQQRSGKIINIASNFAHMGVSHHVAYATSKAAVIAFTRNMAVEWARFNVQVNALAPGYFATDLNAELRADVEAYDRVVRRIPARRMGDGSELGPWAVLLASSASDFMTGETIVIDGGQTAQ